MINKDYTIRTIVNKSTDKLISVYGSLGTDKAQLELRLRREGLVKLKEQLKRL